MIKLKRPQWKVFRCKQRFRVLVAGRRFGKTFLALVELCRAAWAPGRLAWYVAPTYKQGKRIAWKASARRGQLLVRDFEREERDIVWVILEATVVSLEPERLFSFTWHPYAIDPAVDYFAEPTTLVEFRLEKIAAGTRLRVTESGFDKIPAARRALALRMNDGGWAHQVKSIERYVAA